MSWNVLSAQEAVRLQRLFHSLCSGVEALSILSGLAELSSTPDVAFVRGLLFLREKDYVHAEQQLRPLLASSLNRQGVVSLRLAYSIQGQNRIVEAIQILLPVLLRFPQSPYYEDFVVQFACLCFELGDPGQWARVLPKLSWSLENCSDVYRAKVDYLLGLASLVESDYFKGWSLLERRFVAGFAEFPEIFRKRQLTPDCLDQAQQILLYAEPGGAGDVIFSLRFLPLLRSRVKHVGVVCDSAFFDFFRATRLFDAVHLWQDVDALDPSVHALSINSLP